MAEMSALRRRMTEDMTIRNLSPATQRSYIHAMSRFSLYFGHSPDRLGLEDVRRVSEVVALKVRDIDSGRMVLRIECGKGGKERYAMLSQTLLDILRAYWRLARPPLYLFPGRTDKPVEANVLYAACRPAAAAARLDKRVSVHVLRQSFAIHLLEQGADIRVIQVLLGHENLSTAARCTRVSTGVIAGTASPLRKLSLSITPPR